MPDFLAYQKSILVFFCFNGIEMGEDYFFIDYVCYLQTILCYKAFNNYLEGLPISKRKMATLPVNKFISTRIPSKYIFANSNIYIYIYIYIYEHSNDREDMFQHNNH